MLEHMKTLAGFFVGVLAALFVGAAMIGSFSPDPLNTVGPVDIDTRTDEVIPRRDDEDDSPLPSPDDDDDEDQTSDTSPSPSPTARPTSTPRATPTVRPTETRTPRPTATPTATATDDTDDT